MNLNEDKLTQWLGNIHTMETDLHQLFFSQLDTLPEAQDFKSSVKQYVDNTENRKQKIKKILEKFDQDTSKLKTVVTKMLGTAKATMDGMRENEVLHSLASDLGLLQHSIAYYRVAQLMAQELDKKEVSQTIGENMQENLELAETINQAFTKLVKQEFANKKEDKKQQKDKKKTREDKK